MRVAGCQGSIEITAAKLEHQDGLLQGLIVLLAQSSEVPKVLIPSGYLSWISLECPEILFHLLQDILNRLLSNLLQGFLHFRQQWLIFDKKTLRLLALGRSAEKRPAAGGFLSFLFFLTGAVGDFQLTILVLQPQQFGLQLALLPAEDMHGLVGVLQLSRELTDRILEPRQSGHEVVGVRLGLGLLEERDGVVVGGEEGGGLFLGDFGLAELLQPLLGVKH